MTTLQDIPDAASPEVPTNENFETLSASAIYGKRQPVTAGLVWGFYGGLYNGNTIADGTVTLANNADNYVVALRSTGVVSVSSSSANSLDALYAKLYKVTTLSGVVTVVVDQRQDANGFLRGDGTGGGGGSGVTAWKTVVRAASTANGTLASAFENGDTIDGVVLATADDILLKNQSTASENGIYTVNASGAPTRRSDADSGAELINAVVPVSEGTVNADTIWMCSTNGPIVLGSTSLTFAAFVGSSGVAWGSITGTLASQTDLAAALALKQARSPAIQSVASSATVTPTFADDVVLITAQAAGLTLANPTGTAIDCLGMVIRIKDNGTARSIAYGSQYRAIGVTLPAATVVNKTLYLGCIWNATDAKLDVVAVGQEA